MAMNRVGRKFLWAASRAASRFRVLGSRLFGKDDVDRLLAEIPAAQSRADLKGKVAVVTGSTRGVGYAVAKAFAEAGARVMMNGRDRARVEQAVRDVRNAGGVAEGVCADVSTEEGARRLVETAAAAFGGLDLLVNNAAVSGSVGRKVWEMSGEEWEKIIDINLNGAFHCARLAVDHMKRNGTAGRIINVSSGAARSPAAGIAPYAVSKAALEMLTRTLALETGRGGPVVVGVELGTMRTQMARAAFSWEEFQLFPPPETAIPFFLHAATAPGDSVHGRILAAWRFLRDPEGETMLNGPLAGMERFAFVPPRRKGVEVSRFDPAITVLDRAENAMGMPAKARGVLENAAGQFDLSRYPDERCPSLRKALSGRLGLPEECFTFGQGSAELVERTLRTFAQPGDEVLSNDPTWFFFDRFCQSMGLVNRKVPFLEIPGGFDHNLDGLARAVGINTRLIYIVNPSNPMGVGVSADAFRRFLGTIPRHIPVIVDEAYVEYSTRAETLRSHQVVLETDRPVIGLRTFSKFYGLAGLRIGYAFGGRAAMRLFERLEPLFALTSIAEAAAVAALGDEEHAARTLENATRERTRIGKRLADAGLGCFPGEINIMLVECPAPPEKVYKEFEDQGILIPRGIWKDRYILFPIARPDQNDRNLDILLSA